MAVKRVSSNVIGRPAPTPRCAAHSPNRSRRSAARAFGRRFPARAAGPAHTRASRAYPCRILGKTRAQVGGVAQELHADKPPAHHERRPQLPRHDGEPLDEGLDLLPTRRVGIRQGLRLGLDPEVPKDALHAVPDCGLVRVALASRRQRTSRRRPASARARRGS